MDASKSMTILQSLDSDSRQLLEILGFKGFVVPLFTKELAMGGMDFSFVGLRLA